jgi:hypothetical protein
MYVTEEEIKWSKIRGKTWPTERAACTNPFAWKTSIMEVHDLCAMTLCLDGKASYCVPLLSRRAWGHPLKFSGTLH